MVLALPDKWVWDSWYVREGDLWHAFFLQADRSLPDPEDRHWNVSYGHATSKDLKDWDYLGTCFSPAPSPAWDDFTTWTGSVVRGEDGLWHLFYTGTARADNGKRQRIGHATSEDLHTWQRVGDGLALDIGPGYEEYDPQRWHDRAFRDPWVMPDPEGDGWLMYFTARARSETDTLSAGAIGFATSPDLYDWTLRQPVYVGGAGQLEVPQVFRVDDTWYCLFCTGAEHWNADAAHHLGHAPLGGNHYLIGDSPRGPWRLGPGPMLDGANPTGRYAARVLETPEGLGILGFRWFAPEGDTFVGQIDEPVPLFITQDGRLSLTKAA